MKKLFNKIKDKLGSSDYEDDNYVELDANKKSMENEEKLYVRPYIIEDFSDLKPILDHLREGNTISVINIKAMKDKDILELKRAVSKIKKTVEAINGDIRGFGEDHLIIVPSSIEIAKYQTKEEDINVGPKAYYDED